MPLMPLMPPMLPTRRPWPQTRLLTALALLLAAAALMLACGPAAPSAPADGTDALPATPPAQQAGGGSAGESGNDPYTEMPPPPPKPTLTYPNIRHGLHFEVVDFEAAQKSAKGFFGQGDAAVEDTVVLVEIFLTGNKAEVAAWLRSKGITPLHAESPDIANLAAEVPLSLLGELSQLDGVMEVSRPTPTMPGSW